MIKQSLFFLFFATMLSCCTSTTDSKEILFICPHGAARSPIAAAYFNEIAAEKNLNYHAVFRGTEPDETLSARTIEGLTTEGIDVKGWKPKLVSAGDISKAYKIITFDCKVPSENSSALNEQWNGTPSPSKEYESYTKLVKGKVKQLIDQLPSN